MRRFRMIAVLFLTTVISVGLAALGDDYRLAPHPRLLVSNADFATLKQRLATDATLQKWYAQLKKEGDKSLDLPPYKYELRDGVRLLMVSRDIMRRVYVLALLYKIDGDAKYLDRAWVEMANAARYPDWHPVHFLDTAELTHAMAIGYDWLYTDLTPERRTTIRTAIRTLGLAEAIKVYQSKKGWSVVENNWNFVCNGGITLGALAMGDEEPGLLNQVIPAMRASLPRALGNYAPDGAWNESPGYWDYGTSYLAFLIAGLQSALGTDYDLLKTPGLDKTGDFALFMSGPGKYQFGFGDIGGPKGWVSSEVLWFLAKAYHKPEYGWQRKLVADGSAHPLDLLWYDPAMVAQTPDQAKLALDKLFHRVEAASLRSSWSDPNALFVAFKGTDFGDRNHTDLDNGSFFLGAFGEVWATELGSDDYNLPGYFDMKTTSKANRWQLYRKRAEGQNTLVINPGVGPDQILGARAKVIGFQSRPDEAYGIVDLTASYPGTRDVKRGIKLFDKRTKVLIQDEVHLSAPGETWWFMHLPAGLTATLDTAGTTVTLSMPKKDFQLVIRLLEPRPGTVFTIDPAGPLPTSPQVKQNENKGLRKLAIHVANQKDFTLKVVVIPRATAKDVVDFSGPTPALSQWN